MTAAGFTFHTMIRHGHCVSSQRDPATVGTDPHHGETSQETATMSVV